MSVFNDTEMDTALELSRGKRKPFQKTEKWRLATGMNQRIAGPLLNGQSSMELVVKLGGKRKPRKKG